MFTLAYPLKDLLTCGREPRRWHRIPFLPPGIKLYWALLPALVFALFVKPNNKKFDLISMVVDNHITVQRQADGYTGTPDGKRVDREKGEAHWP